LCFADYTEALCVNELVDQKPALDRAIFVENKHRHVLYVVIESITERHHLDQRREKEEKESQRIAPDNDELLEQNCAKPSKRFVFHIVLYKERRLSSRRGDLEIALPWFSFASLRMTIMLGGLLSFSSVFGRKLDKDVFQRRTYFMNFDMSDADFAQLFLDVRALDCFID